MSNISELSQPSSTSELQVLKRRLQIIEAVVEAISKQPTNANHVLETIVEQIAGELRCTHCAIFLEGEDSGERILRVVAVRGQHADEIRKRKYSARRTSIAWSVYLSGESRKLNDVQKAEDFAPPEHVTGEERSMLAAPVKLDERYIGVITADKAELNAFTSDDLHLLETVASQAGIALTIQRATEKSKRRLIFVSYSHQNVDWFQKIVMYLKQLEKASDRELEIWADTLIDTGVKWHTVIQQAIETTKIAVLLVTQDYLSSEYVATQELPALKVAADNGDLKLFWIAVSSSTYKEFGLDKYQCANDPHQPLDMIESEGKRNNALMKIYTKLRTAVNY